MPSNGKINFEEIMLAIKDHDHGLSESKKPHKLFKCLLEMLMVKI